MQGNEPLSGSLCIANLVNIRILRAANVPFMKISPIQFHGVVGGIHMKSPFDG